MRVAAVASAVPLARGVRYLDRFSAYGPLRCMTTISISCIPTFSIVPPINSATLQFAVGDYHLRKLACLV